MKPGLREDALRLPGDERARLARELIESLEGPPDEEVQRLWLAEIERRVQEVQAGTVSLLEWDEIRGRIEARLRSR